MNREQGETSPVERIPVVEESATIGKRQVETGRVRIETHAAERQEIARQELLRTDVKVTQISVDRVVGSVPQVRTEGDLLVIPIVEERMVVTKELVLVKELHVRHSSVIEDHEVPVTLRKTEVVVERIGPDK